MHPQLLSFLWRPELPGEIFVAFDIISQLISLMFHGVVRVLHLSCYQIYSLNH
jgi:hypothetical protein